MRPPFLVLALCLAAGSAAAQQEGLQPPAQWDVENRFLGPASAYADGRHVIVLTPLAELGTATEAGVALAARHAAVLTASWPLPALDETCYVLRLPEDADAAAAAAAVMAEDGVLLAYPIQAFETFQGAEAPEGPAAPQEPVPPREAGAPGDPAVLPVSADPLLEAQATLRTIGAVGAHRVTTGEGMRIALIDSGVALTHPDLAGQDIEGFDFVGDIDGGRSERHGTALASLIVADPGNGIGMAGVAPDATVLALRACTETGMDVGGAARCNTFSLALALDHAVVAGADVLNLSVGGPEDRLLADLVARAQERGALVLAARSDRPFPGGLRGVVPVAGLEAGTGLRAPARDVLGAEPSGGWDFYTGNSVAAAQASGVAALIWSSAPEAEAPAIRRALGDAALNACAGLEALGGAARCP